MLCGDKVKKLGFYEPCVFDKSYRAKFNKGKQRTKGSLDYVYDDLWRTSRIPSHSGARYFMYVVDEYSGNLWIYIHKTKYEAFDNFKSWKTLVKNKSSMKVKRFRTDNCLEFF